MNAVYLSESWFWFVLLVPLWFMVGYKVHRIHRSANTSDYQHLYAMLAGWLTLALFFTYAFYKA